jgi:hypothetical protein
MGESFGKGSWRTFRQMGIHVSNPYWNSPWVKSSDSFKTSDIPPFEALSESTRTGERDLPMSVSATVR